MPREEDVSNIPLTLSAAQLSEGFINMLVHPLNTPSSFILPLFEQTNLAY